MGPHIPMTNPPSFAPAYPQTCSLCGKSIESAEDAMWWHGYGNCVEITPEMEEQWRKEAEDDAKAM